MSDFLEFVKSEINNLYSIPSKNIKNRKDIIDKYIDVIHILRISENEYEINCKFVINLNEVDLKLFENNIVNLKGKSLYIKN